MRKRYGIPTLLLILSFVFVISLISFPKMKIANSAVLYSGKQSESIVISDQVRITNGFSLEGLNTVIDRFVFFSEKSPVPYIFSWTLAVLAMAMFYLLLAFKTGNEEGPSGNLFQSLAIIFASLTGLFGALFFLPIAAFSAIGAAVLADVLIRKRYPITGGFCFYFLMAISCAPVLYKVLTI